MNAATSVGFATVSVVNLAVSVVVNDFVLASRLGQGIILGTVQEFDMDRHEIKRHMKGYILGIAPKLCRIADRRAHFVATRSPITDLTQRKCCKRGEAHTLRHMALPPTTEGR